jgi:hypothetical protein
MTTTTAAASADINDDSLPYCAQRQQWHYNRITNSPAIPKTVTDDECSDSGHSLGSIDNNIDDEDFFDAIQQREVESRPPFQSTGWQTRTPVHSRLGYRFDFVQLKASDKTSQLQKTFAYHLFGERLVMYKMNLTKNQANLPERYQEPNGYCYEILCSKFDKEKQENIPKETLTLYYVLIEGPKISKIDLRKELDKVASWGSLPPLKVPSRLELLFSTAVQAKGTDGIGIFPHLSTNDFEWIPEQSNVGCGFIPRKYLDLFLGTTIRGARTFALQVRIFSSQLGVFKGMLMEKPGIDKIQLPPSMQKVVGISSHNSQACLLINNIFPSNVHLQLAKLLDGTGKPPVSFIPNKLKWMITNLFLSLGVSKESMVDYIEQSHQPRGKGLQHSHVVGVADPTNALPPGHVFITGSLGTVADLPELFVTRFPCTQPCDGLILPVVSSKPDDMAKRDWQFLCSLPFGAIVFANALHEEPSLPSICSNGDLDGDNYFICWNTNLLGQILPVKPAEGEYDDGIIEQRLHNGNWLRDAQDDLVGAFRLARICNLKGKLCMAQKKLIEDCGGNCSDADSLGRAYKDSLEVAKHGKRVRLPSHLWYLLPESVHFLLVDVESPQCQLHSDTQCHKGTNKKARTPASSSGTSNSNSATPEHKNYSDLRELQEGTSLDITGGVHSNKKATFVRLTPQMVRVRISGSTKDTCVSQKHVRPTRTLF